MRKRVLKVYVDLLDISIDLHTETDSFLYSTISGYKNQAVFLYPLRTAVTLTLSREIAYPVVLKNIDRLSSVSQSIHPTVQVSTLQPSHPHIISQLPLPHSHTHTLSHTHTHTHTVIPDDLPATLHRDETILLPALLVLTTEELLC